jgi:hypothetical protein
LHVLAEERWPKGQIEQWKKIGYTIAIGPSARISAVSFDPKAKDVRCVSR